MKDERANQPEAIRDEDIRDEAPQAEPAPDTEQLSKDDLGNVAGGYVTAGLQTFED